LWSKVSFDADETLRFDASEGIAGEALRTGRAICVDDVRRDERFFEGVDSSTGHQTRNLLALPVKNLQGQNVGVFEVINKAAGSFTQEDVALARLLAGQMSIALETAQVCGAMRRDRDALAAANAQLAKELEARRSGRQILGVSAPI